MEKLLDEYFSELLKICRWGKFDVLGHLTYPLRYIVEREGYYPDLQPFEGQIERIFNILIKNKNPTARPGFPFVMLNSRDA